jgi:hypothetical protein
MILIKRNTKINPNQIQLENLFSVERVLASRGFIVKSEGMGEDTLLNQTCWTCNEADIVFNIFDNVTHRKELREYILGKTTTPSEAIKPLTSHSSFINDLGRFGTTFEWYFGELLVRRFKAFSSSYGVVVNDIYRNSDNGESGDFDVLSILGDMNLLYIECKSGATDPKNIKKAIERSYSLHCIATVIVVEKLPDEKLIEMLKMEYPSVPSISECYKLTIKNRPDCEIYKWFNCYFVRASKNVEGKLQTVLRLIEFTRISITQSTEPDETRYASMGYEITKYDLFKR